MSEEEKEAIYELEDIKFDERINKKIEIVLNLINKLQKENEEYKTASNFSEAQVKYIRKYYVDKHKIKAKIKHFMIINKEIRKMEFKDTRHIIEHDITRNDYAIKILEELLEEE